MKKRSNQDPLTIGSITPFAALHDRNFFRGLATEKPNVPETATPQPAVESLGSAQSTLARKNFKQNLPFPSMWFGGPDRYDAHKGYRLFLTGST